MTPSVTLDSRRKRLHFRAWHRGMKEMDLILGHFADVSLGGMSEQDLEAFERVLAAQDVDLYAWLVGRVPVPAEDDTPMFQRIRAGAMGVSRPGGPDPRV